jgi:integrase
MMKDYYQRSMRALQLAGMSKRTQECYTRSVRMLADFYNKTPDQISGSAATMRICYSGIKFFFINVLQRDWHTLELIHAKREQRLPTVLSTDEVRAILAAVNTPQNKAYLTVVYSCGLRLHEALYLQVSDIDSGRMARSNPGNLKILLEGSPQPGLDLPAAWPQRQGRADRSKSDGQRLRSGRPAPGVETTQI